MIRVKEKLIKIEGEYIVITFEEIYEKFKYMIHDICRKWKDNLEYSDIFQVGSIGLYKAYLDYDIAKGNEFSTIAYTYIKNEIRNFYREVKKHFGYLSLNQEMYDSDKTLGDYIKDEEFEHKVLEEITKEQDLNRIYKAFRHLTNRQEEIIKKYFLEGKTMQEIADELGFHVSYIGKVIKNSVKKIQDNIEE
ncbi:RNA polymerase sigma-28 factor precursor [Caloramator mitchellensis]|uniref:RNA polymerase sigma-28 factor n=1 Tax=Caloramator mitchellensis TaxID=908809 RepID=A0A0R3JRS0_CALMK|nr:sigma-70 family RNA polymerase sigma factor [Caloramator mitchellensis]KRQ86182.1 RNA polymerase sigma-28 factor precursor [Caloramator mitchellensis]